MFKEQNKFVITKIVLSLNYQFKNKQNENFRKI